MTTADVGAATGTEPDQEPPSRARYPRSGALRLTLARLAVPVLAVVLWELLAPLTSLVPSAGETVRVLVDGFTSGWIYEGLVPTANAMAVGFAGGAAAGLPLGYLMGRNKVLSNLFEPMVAGTFAVPRVIVYPVFLSIFGVGLEAEAWIVGISAFFPILMSTTASVRNVSPSLLKLGRSLNAGRLQVATKIVVPEAAPGIMVGVRIGFSISLVAAIIAELFAAKNGIGLMIADAQAILNLPRMYALVLLVLTAAFAGNMLLWRIERRLRRDT
jgi:NitT/TauT family transport system permease protein